jgi:hypothetical protein
MVEGGIIRDYFETLQQDLSGIRFTVRRPIEVGKVDVGRCESRGQSNRRLKVSFGL